MLLVVEVGNTNTKIGVFDGARLLVSWRLTSRREQTADEYGVFIETLAAHPRDRLRRTSMGWPSPTSCRPWSRPCAGCPRSTFGIEPFSVEPGTDCGLTLAVDNPREVGADRVVKSVAARASTARPSS